MAFSSGSLTLHGFLYRPPGTGPFPAVIFNHGSERLPGDMRGQAAFYLPHGFVLFIPHRRGQGQSGGAGEYIGNHDYPQIVADLAAQTDDVMSAVDYVRALPFVDRARVTVAGCSFGGIVSLFAAQRGTVPVFFVQAENDFDTTPSLVLSEEMRRARKPVRVHVFPPNGSTHEEGHGFCAGGEHPAWGDEVLEFLK